MHLIALITEIAELSADEIGYNKVYIHHVQDILPIVVFAALGHDYFLYFH